MMTGVRILIVEDEAIVAMLLEDFLCDLGCIVMAKATRLEEGLAQARHAALDIAVLDLNLGGKLSYPIAAALRDRGIPFLFASGYGAGGLTEEWRGTPLITKPFQQHQLEAALRKLLGVAVT